MTTFTCGFCGEELASANTKHTIADCAYHLKAELAERDRMLRLAWERFPYICEAGGEPHAATLDTFLTFYRARAGEWSGDE